MVNALYQTNQSIPQDMLLGNLLFTNLTDMKVSETELIDIFKNNNVPENYVRKISKADAFRRASSSVKNQILFVNNVNTGGKVTISERIYSHQNRRQRSRSGQPD